MPVDSNDGRISVGRPRDGRPKDENVGRIPV